MHQANIKLYATFSTLEEICVTFKPILCTFRHVKEAIFLVFILFVCDLDNQACALNAGETNSAGDNYLDMTATIKTEVSELINL